MRSGTYPRRRLGGSSPLGWLTSPVGSVVDGRRVCRQPLRCRPPRFPAADLSLCGPTVRPCCRCGPGHRGHRHHHRPVVDGFSGRPAAPGIGLPAPMSLFPPHGCPGSPSLAGLDGCSARDRAAPGTTPTAGPLDEGTRRDRGRASGPAKCRPAIGGASVRRMRRVASSGSSASA